MNQEKINRINALYRLSKTRALSPEEIAEQQALRTEYRQSVVGNLTNQLENTTILNPDGTTTKVRSLKKEK